MRIWQSIAAHIARHGKCALVTVVAVKGSSPREPGARMLVLQEGGYSGTVGGGALEWRAIAEAQILLEGETRAAKTVSVVLGPDLGQCCGGQVRLLIETFTAAEEGTVNVLANQEAAGAFATVLDTRSETLERVAARLDPVGRPTLELLADGKLFEYFHDADRHVYLFGAGHVGRALVFALAPLPFVVTWIDNRPGAFPQSVPANTRVQFSADPAAALDNASDGTFALIMTHSHSLDLDITLRALRAGRFPYVGVIGSATKRARFVSRLREVGIDVAQLDHFVCPIGAAGIRSKLPAVIAAATATELIRRDEELRSVGIPAYAQRKAG